MNDLNSVEKHKKIYENWKERFEELVNKLRADGLQVILVAMSRKMPRLIERVNQLYRDGDFKNFLFVSEHVLPYILRNFDPKHQCIVIADDAMYYGSTINRISGYIRAITGQKPHVCPVIVSEVVGELSHAEVHKKDDQIIHVDNIPFLTTHNAEWIIRLCRPIDVEFPILHFNIPSAEKNKEERLLDILKKKFNDCDVYPVKHIVYNEKGEKKPVYSYNVLPQTGTVYDRWNKDFCKIRFFVSDKKIQVISFAPGILPGDVLNDSCPLFTDNRIQQLWEDIRNYQVGNWPDVLPEAIENDLLVEVIENAYKKQCDRSKIMWANYLASFLYLLEQKETIVETLTEVYGKDVLNDAKFMDEDTRLLLPVDKVEDITKTLTHCFKEGRKDNSVFNGLHSAVLANQELSPEEYVNGYSKTLSRNLQRCRTADEALSILFSSQHFFIDNGRLTKDALQRTQRLGFGITYTALENKLSFPIGINGLWQNIHRWVDKNIDEGTVKPKYERVEVDGKVYWVRMFRAGENEDSYTKMRRICERIIDKLRYKEIRGYVKRDMVNDLLTLAWEDPCGIMKYEYKWDEFEKKKGDSAFQILSGGRSFLDFLIDLWYLQELTDSDGVSRIASIEDIKPVTPLSIEQEQAISDYVDVYYHFVELCYQPYIMNNFFPKKWEEDASKYEKTLSEWNRQFAKYMQDYIASKELQKDLSKKMPGYNESFNRIVQHTMMAINITIPNDKNENWHTIARYLQNAEDEVFISYKDKLYSTAVVQELFNQLFIVSEEEKESVEIMKGYLRFIQNDVEIISVVSDYLQMSSEEQAKEENKQAVVTALSHVILNNI